MYIWKEVMKKNLQRVCIFFFRTRFAFERDVFFPFAFVIINYGRICQDYHEKMLLFKFYSNIYKCDMF